MRNTHSRTHFALPACTLLLTLALAACSSRSKAAAPSGPPGQVLEGTPAALPEGAGQPLPRGVPFDGCPPEGEGGDTALNRLKNRTDEGAYLPVAFQAIASLPWPEGVERRDRADWPSADRAAVARHEGAAVAVTGFLVGVQESGAEPANCHAGDYRHRSWRLWLAAHPGDEGAAAIPAVITPRVRAQHPAWSALMLQQLARHGVRVRLSGWLLLDSGRPDESGAAGGTLWEIHPVMRIEVWQNGQWITLDDYSV